MEEHSHLEDLMTLTEVCQKLDIYPNTLYRMLDRQELNFVIKPGTKKKMYRKIDIQTIIDSSLQPRSRNAQ